MNAIFSITGILIFTGAILNLICAAVLIMFHQKGDSSRKLLINYFLSLGIGLIFAFGVESRMVMQWPHFFRVALLFAYIYPPFAFLYVKSHIYPRIVARDLLLFLPAAFYLVDYLPFFLQPAEVKLTAAILSLDYPDMLMAHGEGWLTPPWFHMVLRNVMCLAYWIMSAMLIYKIRKCADQAFFKENKYTFSWLLTFVVMQALFFMPYLLFALSGWPQITFYTTILPIVIMAIVTSIGLIFRPAIFYGFTGMLLAIQKAPVKLYKKLMQEHAGTSNLEQLVNEIEISPEQFSFNGNRPDQVDKSTLLLSGKTMFEYLSPGAISNFEQNLESFLEHRHPFLDPKMDVNHFSSELRISPRKLSAYIHATRKMSFFDFINKNRVEFCARQLVSGAWNHHSMEHIANECGFINRSTFINSVRKFYSVTPSVFISELKVKREPVS